MRQVLEAELHSPVGKHQWNIFNLYLCYFWLFL